MAKLERSITGDFDTILRRVDEAVLGGSLTASLEEISEFRDGSSRCSVRVYERYSWLGSNRVSMTVTLFQGFSGRLWLSAVTSGGSQAAFFKLNTWGEEAFLDTIRHLF